MNAKRFPQLLLATALALLPLRGGADDIDLYTGGQQVTGAAANVLIILDNSSNWALAAQNWAEGKQGISELQTLSEVASTLTDNINLGLMTFAQSGSSMEGQVRFHIRTMDASNRGRFQAITNHMAANAVGASDPDEVSSSSDYDILMNSAFRYFNGKARHPYINNAGQDRKDHRDNLATGVFDPSPNPSGYAWAYDTAGQSTYNKPAEVDAGCAKNFIIFIGNGFPSGIGSSAELQDAAGLIGKTADVSVVTPISPKNPWADEWARFMYTYGVPSLVDDPANPGQKLNNKITTYTIDVCKDHCESTQETLLRSMARVGGGKYFRSTSKSQIKSALATIFAEIQSVNSVFASATLPISVNTQGTYENQVYIGTFRPDAGARPRWFGNLKEYRFARYCDFNGNDLVDNIGASVDDERIDRESGNAGAPTTCSGDLLKLFLADRDNKPAIDQSLTTGFIDLSATSFWTTDSSYWSFMPSATGSISDKPDGPAVERGGAAQRLRGIWAATATAPHPDGRKIFTCLDNCLAAGATAAQKTLSNNAFTTSNAELTAVLAAPSGAVSVGLVRSGATVTATTVSGNHGFNPGDSVVIAGASQAAYNGTVSVLTTPSSSSFTYAISETPATSVNGAIVAATAPSISATSITLSTTVPGANATVSVSGLSSIPAGTTSATIAGASQSFLNGTKTGTTTAGGVFQYSVTLPSVPSATATGVMAQCGTNAAEPVASASWSSGTFTFSNGTSNFAGCKSFSGTVVISGASNALYNGTWTTATSGNKVFTVSFAAATPVSPDPGAGKSITPASTLSYVVDITRALGASTATATVQGGGTHALPSGTAITVTGASDNAYNGPWTTLSGASGSTSFTFGAFTPSPSSPAGGSVTATLSGITSGGPTTANLINWMRGKDLWEDENLNASLTDVRASIHGDVLHSRPLLVNYGGSIGIVGFYGANDGFLRAVSGGVADTDGAEKWAFIPKEFTTYSKLSRLYANSELVRFPNSTCSILPAPTPRGYYWDGQLAVYQSTETVKYPDPVNGPYIRPEKTWLYAGMRRGGRSLYALDVSDPDTPKFMWKISNTVSGFEQLGQTWSEPKVAKIKGKKADGTDDLRKVLIFGAGYDPTDDDQPPGCPRGDHPTYALAVAAGSGVTCPNASGNYSGVGRGVFIVDAETGAKVNFLAPPSSPPSPSSPSSVTKYSFPADVAIIDMDGDGYIDRIYAGDSGAQLFRFDLDQTKQLGDSTAYVAYHLARLGDINPAGTDDTLRNGGTDARKFLFPPEVLPFTYRRSDGATSTAIMLIAGSGDREKPLNNRDKFNNLNVPACGSLYNSSYFGTKVRDKFYGIIDAMPAGGTPAAAATESNLFAVNTVFGSSTTALSSFKICYGFETTCDGGGATNPLYRGWVMNFKNSVGGDSIRDEEKMVSAPRVVSGIVLFGTNTPQAPNPAAGVCSNLGEARAYAVDPFSGLPKFDRDGDGVIAQADYSAVVTGGGLPPSVTAGVVGIGGEFYRFVIGAGGQGSVASSPIAGAKNPITLRGTRSRVYWYYPVDDK